MACDEKLRGWVLWAQCSCLEGRRGGVSLSVHCGDVTRHVPNTCLSSPSLPVSCYARLI